jgi:ubiquinol-cytochrome c reductase iron-sulfur subunit
MADTISSRADHSGDAPHDPPKRDFMLLLAGSGAAIAVGSLAWPLIDSMNPSKDVLALSSIDVDLGPIAVGQGITVVWRGKPVFVRHRTPEEIKAVEAVPLNQLIEPASDQDRTKAGHAEWIVLVGICTHLGCVPLGNKPSDPRGDFGGWFCPCHGSQYDVSGRVRHGPAPANLAVPGYAFTTDTKIKIG